ncbi:hypothetical protein JCM10296v2_006835 [Rhodotorula toruloides]
MAGLDVFDSAANARRAEQHAELGPQLKALTDAIELYDASTNAKPSFEASKTAPLFVPLLIRDSLPSWIDVKERLGRFFGIANMEMGEMEAGEYGVELVARTLRRTVDFEGEEAQFANAVKNLVRLVHVELPDERQAKPANAVQLPVVQGAQQPPTPPAEREAAAFPTPALRYDSSATKGKGRAVDPKEVPMDDSRHSQTPSPPQAREEPPKTPTARVDGQSTGPLWPKHEEEDLPEPGLARNPYTVVPRLAPPDGLVFPLNMDLAFTREQMGPQLYTMIGTGGKKDGSFTLAHHWLASQMEPNLCGADGQTIAPGEPLAIISLSGRLDEVAAAVSYDHRPDKPYEGINVFVSQGVNNWLYCGRYQIIHDGRLNEYAQPLPTGPLDEQEWPPHLRRVFACHAGDNKVGTGGLKWRQRVLQDWNFRTTQNLATADKELEAAQTSDSPRPVMRYLVLACDGVDDESLAVWKANKLSGKRKAPEGGDKPAKKERSARVRDDDAYVGGSEVLEKIGGERRLTRSSASAE